MYRKWLDSRRYRTYIKLSGSGDFMKSRKYWQKQLTDFDNRKDRISSKAKGQKKRRKK